MEDLRKPEIFAACYERIYQDLYRFALYTLGNPQDAEDAVSEAVADAYASVGKLRNAQSFRSWMFAIVANKCRRKRKEYINRPGELMEEIRGAEEMEESVQVRDAFSRLSAEDRLLISMQVFGGYKSHEIGQIMDMNQNTVRSRIHRALGKMREMLQ
ncbi:MAG: RNA polymerase sigma factor [Eubacteriales bacterium]|nr:RNA polymerase sigma factor [Eubacteriales bacterium]